MRALKEVDQAAATLEGDIDRRQAIYLSLQDATRAFALARDRRAAGATGDIDVFLAEQALLASTALLASADARIADDQVQLFRSLGGGWQQVELMR